MPEIIEETQVIEDDLIPFLRREPFWGHIIISLTRSVDYTLNAPAAVGLTKGGIRFYYNPAMYFSYPLDQRLAILEHEALHVANRHFCRIDAVRDGSSLLRIASPRVAEAIKNMHKACLMKVLNYGADMAINPLINNMSSDFLFPENYQLPEGLSFEQYVVLLLEKMLDDKESQSGNGNKKASGDGKDGQSGGQGEQQDQQSSGDSAQGDKGKQKKNTSAVGGSPQSQKGKQPGAAGGGCCPGCGFGDTGVDKRMDHSKWDGAEGELTEADVRAAEAFVTGLIKECHQRGLIPGNMESMFQDIIKPRMNIRRILNMFVASCKSEDLKRTWHRVNRRLPYRIKGKKRDDQLTLVVAIDSSGSVTDRFLQLFAGFLRAFHRSGARIIVIVCDAEIQSVYEFTGKLTCKFKGRGGTAFEPVFIYLSERRISADGIIYLTDGAGDNPPPFRRAKVLWLVTPNGDVPAKWGRVVFLPQDVM